MTIGVVRFPGSNCDDDVMHAITRVMGLPARWIWHKDHDLAGVSAVVLPGGFSHGDYLRAGAIAARAPVMDEVRRFATAGGPVLGVCNGFQILCEAGLLEGALMRNAGLHFVCKDVHLVVEGRPTPFSATIPAGSILRVPIAHAEGRYHHPAPDTLFERGMVVFRYVDESGGETPAANPNGSLRSIAGVCNERGNVLGLMPHPERVCEAVLGGEDGKLIFDSLKQALGGKS
jgi:phosphoribosylformylglycinamidine synthase